MQPDNRSSNQDKKIPSQNGTVFLLVITVRYISLEDQGDHTSTLLR